ncbi:hypothetical protein ACFPU1_13755 [Thalassorhabdus alkalitolerans]|uniref:Homeodomain phBC6A51-type domain-containing protein n=1 Tax=Thalassorhabdus alkalitolerans TaxID=2282697 RepID=A0ABW0YU01_9BACI
MPKATKGYKREQGLTIEQLNAIDLLIAGKSDQDVANVIEVNRVTITKWRNYDVYFRAELNKRRKELWGASIDKMRAILPKAIERLEKEIEKEHGWKVAIELLKISGVNNTHITTIGHEEVDKILGDEAEKKLNEELFSNVSDYSKREVLEAYQQKLTKT